MTNKLNVAFKLMHKKFLLDLEIHLSFKFFAGVKIELYFYKKINCIIYEHLFVFENFYQSDVYIQASNVKR